MNLKELIKEVEDLKRIEVIPGSLTAEARLESIKQTVEAVDRSIAFDESMFRDSITGNKFKDWQKLKKLLGIK